MFQNVLKLKNLDFNSLFDILNREVDHGDFSMDYSYSSFSASGSSCSEKSMNFDKFCEKVREQELKNAGQTSWVPWKDLDTDIKQMYYDTVQATLEILDQSWLDYEENYQLPSS